MEFEIKGRKYSARKLNVFEQLKVSRKLMPVLSGIVGELNVLRQVRSGEVSIEDAVKTALPSIAQALSDISDEDSDAIIHPCLSVVSIKNGDSYNPIFVNKQLMFDDIDLLTMLQIVARVIGDSLGNFLGELPDSPTPGQAPA